MNVQTNTGVCIEWLLGWYVRWWELAFFHGGAAVVVLSRDGNGLGQTRTVPTRNPTRQKKIRLLLARLPAGYPLKKYPRIFLKHTGTYGYPILANI